MSSILHKYLYPLFALVFVLGLGVGFWYGRPNPGLLEYDMTREGGYEYINPLLSCDISEDVPYSGYNSLVQNMSATVDASISSGAATRVSVYFREMNSGRWTGINTDGLYAPASLMKVPLLIAILKESQADPKILQTPVAITTPDGNSREVIKPEKPLIVGRSYSVDDALRAMIVDSDNNAAQALNRVVQNDSLADVYGDFGLPTITDENQNILSPKMYMRLFRILYNASYLWRGKSQTAFELMSKSSFTEGIVAGVPLGTAVSHKFGEREIYTKDGTLGLVQLHDCGIVYYPRSPYGICIMTEGSSIESLKSVLAAVSKVAYTEVKNGVLAH